MDRGSVECDAADKEGRHNNSGQPQRVREALARASAAAAAAEGVTPSSMNSLSTARERATTRKRAPSPKHISMKGA